LKNNIINNMQISRLTLGTAQLGSPYGIANMEGKLSADRVRQILRTALDNGISCFDTAPAYGNAEEEIGSFLSDLHNYPKKPVIITKLPPVNKMVQESDHTDIYSLISHAVNKSTDHLHIKQIPIYLLHRTSDIYAHHGLVMEVLLDLKNKGLLGVLGVSVYTPEEVEATLNAGVFGAIQVPINIFDHRLLNNGLLKELKRKNYIILARSVFLQGLFFIDPSALPPELSSAQKSLELLQNLAARWNLDMAKLALLFVRDVEAITSIIIGAETPNQILRNVEIMDSPPLPQQLRDEILSIFAGLPTELINPSMWK
jgi:aryl-alcohol dehydrogenase-like predicted oxidoreductase